jgi:ribonucleotide reductase alpha subunit
METIAREGTLSNISNIPDDIKQTWVCSHDISYEWHVRMQVAFQKHTDNAVSKTINLPYDAPVEDVRAAYLSAWANGLKGITVYRDASRASQVLNIRKTDAMKRDTKYGDRQFGSSAAPRRHSICDDSLTAGQTNSAMSSALAVAIASPPTNTMNVYDISERGCVECGSINAYEARYEACVICRVCGYTKC